MGRVPVDGAPQALFEVGPRDEAEAIAGAGGVQRAPRLTVRLRGVPDDLAAEIGQATISSTRSRIVISNRRRFTGSAPS